MATQMTARVPTTPEVHEELKDEMERRDAPTFDALLRDLLAEASTERPTN